MPYTTCEPITTNVEEKRQETIRDIMDETANALGELRAQLTDLDLMIRGKAVEALEEEKASGRKEAGIEINCMTDRAEVNRRNTVACLKLAVIIKQALIG